jgi:hypothetical protein
MEYLQKNKVKYDVKQEITENNIWISVFHLFANICLVKFENI